MSYEIDTVEQFDEVLKNGPYAWPGGYPLYFITDDGEALSFEAAQEHAMLVRDAIRIRMNYGGWRVIGCEVNWEDPDLFCSHSGLRIPSAYEVEDEEASTQYDQR